MHFPVNSCGSSCTPRRAVGSGGELELGVELTERAENCFSTAVGFYFSAGAEELDQHGLPSGEPQGHLTGMEETFHRSKGIPLAF